MSKTSPNYNCLFRIPNDETNRNIIKEVRKMMKDYGTMWRLVIRGRKPKPGSGPYPYGSVPLKNAQELGIYLYEKECVRQEKWKRQYEWQNSREKQKDEEYLATLQLQDQALKRTKHLQEKAERKLAELVGLISRSDDARSSIRRFLNEYSGGKL